LLLCTVPAAIDLSVDELREMTAGCATIFLVVFLLASYWTGILIKPLGALCHELYRYGRLRKAFEGRDYTKQIERLRRVFGLPALKPKDSSRENLNTRNRVMYFWKGLTSAFRRPAREARKRWEEDLNTVERVMHEFLKSRSDEARLILPKMKAGVTLCDNSFVAMLGAGIFVLALEILHRLQAGPLLLKLLPIALGIVAVVVRGALSNEAPASETVHLDDPGARERAFSVSAERVQGHCGNRYRCSSQRAEHGQRTTGP
jgi:hypothetical protein